MRSFPKAALTYGKLYIVYYVRKFKAVPFRACGFGFQLNSMYVILVLVRDQTSDQI